MHNKCYVVAIMMLAACLHNDVKSMGNKPVYKKSDEIMLQRVLPGWKKNVVQILFGHSSERIKNCVPIRQLTINDIRYIAELAKPKIVKSTPNRIYVKIIDCFNSSESDNAPALLGA